MKNKTHKQVEELLRENEEKFRLISENSKDVICLHHPDGRYIYVSPSCKNILGYDPEKLIGTNPWELVHPEDLENLNKESVKVLKGENVLLSYRIRKKSGEYIWFESVNQIIKDDKGNVIHSVSSSRNITKRKQAEEELKEHREHLEELVKERTSELEEKNKELERFNKLFVNREFRIKELKDKVKEMEKQIEELNK